MRVLREMLWSIFGRSDPVQIERRDEVLYETYGQQIKKVVVGTKLRTIRLDLENGWAVEFNVDADGFLSAPVYIEPFGDTSVAAVKNVVQRIEGLG